MELFSNAWWSALLAIVLIDLVLAGGGVKGWGLEAGAWLLARSGVGQESDGKPGKDASTLGRSWVGLAKAAWGLSWPVRNGCSVDRALPATRRSATGACGH